ncbi:MAG: DUF4384 domain-containing protein [Acidobacteriota bacterium]
MQKRLFIPLALALVFDPVLGGAQEPTTRDLSEMFYNDTLPAKKEEPAPKPKPVAKKPVRKKSTQPVVNVSAPERRMGVKYRILLRTPDCDIREVDPTHNFHSGDKVRLQVESNVDGYLYVMQKGTTGKDRLLFPDARINGGDNKISRGILYTVPANQWFTFDNNPGIEKLTVAVTRTPMKSITQPAKPKQEDEAALVSVVSVVEELNQNVRSRDLVLFQEKAPVVSSPEKNVSSAPVQSTIVVNTSEDSNNAVYTEIHLKHN